MKNDLPIACTLSDAALEERKTLFAALQARIREHRPIDRGLAARFDGDPGTLTDLARFVDLERDCCRFLRFELTVEPDGGPIWLGITGPVGAETIIREMMG